MVKFNPVSKFIFAIFFVLSVGAIAQKPSNNNLNKGSIFEVVSKPYYDKIILGSDDAEKVKSLLKQKIKNLSANDVDIKLCYDKTSPLGKHYTYQQYYHNYPVYNGTVKVGLDKDNNIYLIVDETMAISNLDVSKLNAQVANLSKEDFVKNNVVKRSAYHINYTNEINICVNKENEAFAVQKIEMSCKSDDSGFDMMALIDEEGNTVYQRDLRRYLKNHSITTGGDSITVSIFKPNPVTYAHAVAGGSYADNNDADNATLTADRVNVKVVATYTNGVYTLVNNYIKMVNLTAPNNTVPTSTTGVFNFTRNPDQFEEIGAFYHVTKMQEYIQSIGFNNLCNFQTQCDAHGTTQDNSWFTPGPNSLTIGDGCVDDGEDADVFIHEYGHAVSHSANNNSFSSADRGALDEAFGDYQATTYRRIMDAYDWGYVFPWDGIPACWGGRRCDRTKVYPAGLVNEVHADGEIWASAMMSIWTVLGKDVTDKLQYTSLYNWTNNMTMPNAAQLVINADNILYGGSHFSTLCAKFTQYGLYSGSCMTPCINPTAGGTIALSQTVCSNVVPALLTNSISPSGNTGTLEYMWYASTTSSVSGFSAIASATNTTYQAGLLSQSTWFKRLSRVSCMTTWTNAATSNVVKITVNPTYTFSQTQSICNGETYNWQGNNYTTANTYTVGYTTINGCDSIYSLNLTVKPTYSFSETQSICNGETYNWHGNNYTTANTYTVGYTTINGCDSIYSLNLTVKPTYTFSQTQSICNGETYNWRGNNYTTANTYSMSYSTVNGCDSVYFLTLNVNTVNTSVTVSGLTIMSNLAGTSYQWVDCNNLFATINGAQSQSFTPSSNGSYAVIVTQGLCSDTSNCSIISTVGINENTIANDLSIYPNPFSNELFIEINEKTDKVYELEFINTLGEVVFKDNIKQNTLINTTQFAAGVYFIKIKNAKEIEFKKLIKN